MPSMPTYHVSKGTQLGFLDDTLGGANFLTEYAAALTRLRDADPAAVLGAAARAHLPSQLSQSDVDHLTNHWLGNWWPALAVPDTLRAGFSEAIRHGQSVQKPMEVLWICATDQAFHVYYCEGPRQVTVLLFTPPPAQHTTAPLNKAENIWVVKLEDPFDALYPNKDPGGGIPAPVTVATVTTGPAHDQSIIKQRLFHG